MPPGWHFWVDRGGTFTDLVARAPDGRLLVHKLLSEQPGRRADAVVQGVRDLLDRHGAAFPGAPVAEVRIGTTVGTNALLERRGDRVALAITRGFRDALRIGYQDRPDLFALRIQRPDLLYQAVVEIDARVDARGRVLRRPDLRTLRRQLAELRGQGFRNLAVVLMHAYRYPAHERLVAAAARAAGFRQVSMSHEVSALVRLVSRGDTTVLDAYLSPLLGRYVDRTRRGLARVPGGRHARLLCMQSHGGLVAAGQFRGRDCILSGPAGGLVGAAAVAEQGGLRKIIAFDMGGTSTDVSHYSGAWEYGYETRIAGVRIRAPHLQIHTVAAGGGSILRFKDGRFQVGPESAGARPGPACYRQGGPLTVTDANVLLGRIAPALFPRVCGPRGNQPLDRRVVDRLFRGLAREIRAAGAGDLAPDQVAEGFLDVAVENMAHAIKSISVQRGHHLKEYTLCCFGGAAGQHACRVADALDMPAVYVHPLAGVLSAYGLGLARPAQLNERTVETPLARGVPARLEPLFAELEQSGTASLARQGVPRDSVTHVRRLLLKYEGTDTTLAVAWDTLGRVRASFAALHEARFGFGMPRRRIVVAAITVETRAPPAALPVPAPPPPGRPAPRATGRGRMYARGAWHAVARYRWERLPGGARITGPALIAATTHTVVVEPGWQARMTSHGALLLTRVRPPPAAPRRRRADPVLLEIFNRRFMAVAEHMGYALQNTAQSVNIKERLDFSCAVFDAAGELIANAPHIPVHLGSMGACVQAIRRAHGRAWRAGDAYLVNSPFHGGTHLPDLTVVAPVFDAARRRLLFIVAARGHHADVGGITPGSMPPASRTIEHEGALTAGLRVACADRFAEAAVRAWLRRGPHPARNPDQNVADLRAQLAACAHGAAGLCHLVAHYSLPVVEAYQRHVRANAEEAVRQALTGLAGGAACSELDNGAMIHVRVTVDPHRRTARIDFTGTAPQQPDNFNAPRAVVTAAVLYVFRTLAGADIPLNGGCLAPLEIIVPPGSLLDPRPPAAVVAGNVETSQVIVDTLFAALGVQAASQGTMNNLTFGSRRHQYYETLCGGGGAGPGYAGASAVHTHMTNSRITDPEVLEMRYPVLVQEFSLRPDSGGSGRWRGGDGVIRRLCFLEPMTVAILSGRRRVAPPGLAGGDPGLPGRNYILRADGRRVDLQGTDQRAVRRGDRVVIETPGGGGYGPAGRGA